MTTLVPPEAIAQGDIADALAADGYVVVPDYFERDLCSALVAEALALSDAADAIDAGTGRRGGHDVRHDVRRTRIRWLDGSTNTQTRFLREAEVLRALLNRTLFLGLRSFEAQLALTPPGGYYKRHVDSFAGARNRIVSLIAYLDPDWQPGDGGMLRVWPSDGDAIDIAPRAGTLVMLRAEDVAHEVLVTAKPRPSLAGWFRLSET